MHPTPRHPSLPCVVKEGKKTALVKLSVARIIRHGHPHGYPYGYPERICGHQYRYSRHVTINLRIRADFHVEFSELQSVWPGQKKEREVKIKHKKIASLIILKITSIFFGIVNMKSHCFKMQFKNFSENKHSKNETFFLQISYLFLVWN